MLIQERTKARRSSSAAWRLAIATLALASATMSGCAAVEEEGNAVHDELEVQEQSSALVPARGIWTAIRSNKNGLCLDVNNAGTANGTTVFTWACSGATHQTWLLNQNGQLIDLNSGRCLDVIGAGTAPGTGVQLWDCLQSPTNQAKNQSWFPTGANQLLSLHSGLCLNAAGFSNGAPLRLETCASSGTALQNQGFFRIGRPVQNLFGGKCLQDVAPGMNGALPELRECSASTTMQRFSFMFDGRIISPTGKCLDVINAGTASGTGVQLWDCNGFSQQSWQLRGDGTIRSWGPDQGTPRCLSAVSTASGSTLQVVNCNSSSLSQAWLSLF